MCGLEHRQGLIEEVGDIWDRAVRPQGLGESADAAGDSARAQRAGQEQGPQGECGRLVA
jgi:hypothetical protein